VWDDGLEILFYEMMDGRPGLEKHGKDDAVICDFSGMTDAAVYGWPGLICERPGGPDRSEMICDRSGMSERSWMIYGMFVGRAARIRRCLICLAGLRCLDMILQDYFLWERRQICLVFRAMYGQGRFEYGSGMSGKIIQNNFL
jgi:hypothetical protein